jgi:uncharacterized protein YjdB
MHVSRCSHEDSHPTIARFNRGMKTLALMALSSIVACKQSADPEKVAALVGLNSADSVRLGKTISFIVDTRDAAGNKVTGRRINWSSINPNVASVDANGVVTGVGLGSAIITARADGATAQTNVLVQPVVASVVLFPSPLSLPVGSTRPLTVTVNDKNGVAILGRTVEFSSSNPTVATVNANGTVQGVSQGTAVITGQAVLDQVSGTSTVTITQVPVASVAISPPGAQTVFQGLTLQLAATLRDASGNILSGRPISWNTSNSSIATVSSSGMVTGVALGSVQITAESEGVASATSIAVQPRPVATVGLGPNPGSLKAGTQLQMALDLRDASGNQLTTVGRSVTWDSSNKPVATVLDGVVAGVSPGSATISVTVDGKSASAIVTVTP